MTFLQPRLHSAGWLKALLLATSWGAIMALSAAVTLFLIRDGAVDPKTMPLIAIFAIGGFTGFCLAFLLLRFVPERWVQTRRFATAFILFGLATIGATAFLFALQFRAYFVQWHDDTFSRRLVYETVFTLLSAVYQFLVLGVRLYLPIGLIGLFVVSTAFARRRI